MVIADWVECQNYAKVAKKWDVSATTVKNWVRSNPESLEMFAHKKEENQKSVVEHMGKKADVVCDVIDAYLEALLDPQKIAKATPSQLSTVIGTLIDKYVMVSDGPVAGKEVIFVDSKKAMKEYLKNGS